MGLQVIMPQHISRQARRIAAPQFQAASFVAPPYWFRADSL